MPASTRIDDPIAEDLLTGEPVRADLEPLATALETLRDVSRQPVPASLELADRIAAGAFPRRTTSRVVARLAAVGVAVALVGGGTAGFAGSLPEPVQQRFETVVESVTPFELPRTASAGDPPAEREAEHRGEPSPVNEGEDPAEFGDRVSEDARTGGVDGPEVSEDARRDRGAVVEGPGPPAELPPPARVAPGAERRQPAAP